MAKAPDNVHVGHRNRLKKRFLSDGLDCFEHHNVLELLLFYAIPRIDTNIVAHNLINEFGSISGVFDTPVDQLIKVDQVSESAATLLHLIPQLSRVYLESKTTNYQTLDSSVKIGEYFKTKFIGRNQELVYLLCLDSTCSIIACDVLTFGTVSRANINIRKIVDIVVRYNACSVILAHNHPRGIAAASNDDVITTKYIFDALKLLDIPLLDHIIVANDDYASLAELGYIG